MPVAGQIIRATDIANLIGPYYAVSNLVNTFTTGTGNVRQNINGLTFDVTTVNPNALVIATWTLDVIIVTTVAGNNMQFRLEVDGVSTGPLALCSTTTASNRVTCSQQTRVTHTLPGTYTYQVSGLSSSATAGATVQASNSTLTALVVDQA